MPAPQRIRALSVRQPWASLIASGTKTLELRSRPATYRGPVLIVTGQRVWAGDHQFQLGPTGVTICLVDLVGCRRVSADDAAAACIVPPEGYEWGWELANPRPVPQEPHKGKLGLYTIDYALPA